MLPPLYQATSPNLNQTPPHLKSKPKKAKFAPSIVHRRSHRLMSSIGTKKTRMVDTIVHEISDDDVQEESVEVKSLINFKDNKPL